MLTFDWDISEFKIREVQTRRTLGTYTVRAVRAGLREGAARARSNHVHTKRTGHLTSAAMLRGELQQANENEAWGYLVNDADYAAHVEYGTAPHRIEPIDYTSAKHLAKNPTGALHSSGKRAGMRVHNPTFGAGRGQFLRFYINGGVVFARAVDHPGTPPMPFMVPASEYAASVIVRETEHVTIPALVEIWE